MPPGMIQTMRQHQRFFNQVIVTDGCWKWTGPTRNGKYSAPYGATSVGGKSFYVHRLAYTWLVGPIPPLLTIDHLCKNTLCVNPAHMEVVTRYVNWERQDRCSPVAYAKRTHCSKGHEYSGYNVMWVDHRRKSGAYSRHRICRKCHNDYFREYKRTHKKTNALNDKQSNT